MKIKTTKKMRLDELIKYIFDNDEKNRIFIDDGEQFAVHSNSSCAAVNIEHLKDGGKKCISKDDIFTVEAEEELKEETPLKDFDLVGLIRKRGREKAYYEMGEWSLSSDTKVSISGIKDIYDLKSLHKINDDGSLTLLYTEENGIPEEGMIELWIYL